MQTSRLTYDVMWRKLRNSHYLAFISCTQLQCLCKKKVFLKQIILPENVIVFLSIKSRFLKVRHMTSYSERRLRRMVDEWWALRGKRENWKVFSGLKLVISWTKTKAFSCYFDYICRPLVNACLIWEIEQCQQLQKKSRSYLCGTFTIWSMLWALLQEQIMTGTDLSLLAEEMRKAQEILKKIMEMKSGVMGDTRIAVQASADSTLSTVSISHVVFPNKAWWFCLLRVPSHEGHKFITF